MDENKVTSGAETAEKTVKKKAQEAPAAAPETDESVYTLHDLIDGHKAFGVPKEIVTVALRLANIETATFAEAKKIIDEFKKKEVK